MVRKRITTASNLMFVERLATLNLRHSSIGQQIIRVDQHIGLEDARITSERLLVSRRLWARSVAIRRIRGFIAIMSGPSLAGRKEMPGNHDPWPQPHP